MWVSGGRMHRSVGQPRAQTRCRVEGKLRHGAIYRLKRGLHLPGEILQQSSRLSGSISRAVVMERAERGLQGRAAEMQGCGDAGMQGCGDAGMQLTLPQAACALHPHHPTATQEPSEMGAAPRPRRLRGWIEGQLPQALGSSPGTKQERRCRGTQPRSVWQVLPHARHGGAIPRTHIPERGGCLCCLLPAPVPASIPRARLRWGPRLGSVRHGSWGGPGGRWQWRGGADLQVEGQGSALRPLFRFKWVPGGFVRGQAPPKAA